MNRNVAVFFSDEAMLPGLHVALYTLIENISQDYPIDIVVFADRLSIKNIGLLKKTVEQQVYKLSKINIKFQVKQFSPPSLSQGGNSLHGNTTTYGRCFLGELLPQHTKCLYIDSDVYIGLDISKLIEEIPLDNVLLADGYTTKGKSFDHELYRNAQLDSNSLCFNAGVLGINLRRWRSDKIYLKCVEITKKFPGQFKSADQAVLNIALHNKFDTFDERYNFKVSPNSEVTEASYKSVVHFLGNPKPWDLGGRICHNYFQLWGAVYKKTAAGSTHYLRFSKFKRNCYVLPNVVKRVWFNTVGGKI